MQKARHVSRHDPRRVRHNSRDMERRSVDRGIEARRTSAPLCDVLPSETLARYLTQSIGTGERGAVEAHLQGCAECWAVIESAYMLFASHDHP